MIKIDIVELVSNSLISLNIPTIYGWYDANLNATHITYLEFENVENEFTDDEATKEEHYIQVDIWTKDTTESQALKKQVKTLLKSNGLLYQDSEDQYETNTELWHIAQRWLYVEDLDT